MTLSLQLPRTQIERHLGSFAGGELASELVVEGWGWRAGEIPHPSRILAERSEVGKRLGELYDDMVRADTDLEGLWDKRCKAVLKLPRRIDPADSTPKAVEAAKFVREALSLIPQRVINVRAAHEGILKGISVQELLWEKIGRGPLTGAWLPVDIKDRPMWRFGFERATGRIFVRGRAGQPVPAPDFKFAALANGTKDSPWGLALLDFLYWAWFLKRHASKYWAIFVERFAQPLVVGKYPHRSTGNSESDTAANTEQQETLLKLISTIQTGRGFVIPDGLDIVLLEAARAGDGGYQGFLGWLTRAMALVLLGEVDTSGLAKGPGSFAKSQVSNEVRLETVNHDAHLIGSWETETIVRMIVEINLGLDVPMPRSVLDATDAGDRQIRLEGIRQAIRDKVAVPLGYYRMTLQIPAAREGEEVVGDASPSPVLPEPTPAKAQGGEVLARFAAEDLDDLGASVEALENDLDRVVESFAGETAALFAEDLAALGSAFGEAGASVPLSLVTSRTSDRLDLLESALIHGVGLSLFRLRESGLLLAEGPDHLEQRRPATALDFWLRLLAIPKSLFERFSDAMRRILFTVARITEASVLLDVHRLIARAQAEGFDRARFVREAQELYERHGLTPTSKHHLELIFSNNVRGAAHLARFQQLIRNPAARRLVAYVFWWVVDDERVRERRLHNHLVVHGFTAPPDHPFWLTWWPLAGHACRCGVGTISHPEARRRGLTGSEPSGPWPVDPKTGAPALPDPGFQGPADDLRLLEEDLDGRVAGLLEQARREGSQELIDAIENLFRGDRS